MSVICVSCTAILIGSLFRCVVDFILLDCGRESLWNQICPTRFNMCIVWRCAFSLFQTQAIGDTKFILGFLSLFCWTLLIPFFKKKDKFWLCLFGGGRALKSSGCGSDAQGSTLTRCFSQSSFCQLPPKVKAGPEERRSQTPNMQCSNKVHFWVKLFCFVFFLRDVAVKNDALKTK